MAVLKLLSDPKANFGHQWSADPVDVGVCMTLIAEALGLSQPTVSRHLEILKQAGFISVQKHLKWSYCKRNEAALQDFMTWLDAELVPKA